MARWTCGDESVENINDFSEATKRHIQDNIEKVLSEILSDQYGCKVRIRFGKKTEVISMLETAMSEAKKIYGAGNYKAKLAYAEKFLEKHGINLPPEELKLMVDAEIKKTEQAEAVAENKVE